MRHELKILPCYYQAVADGVKLFEIRDNSDRGFQKGDIVTLNEWDRGVISGNYTGRSLDVKITYVTGYEQKDNFVVFGFCLLDETQ